LGKSKEDAAGEAGFSGAELALETNEVAGLEELCQEAARPLGGGFIGE
jgi:hypothetical protein